MSDAHAAGAGGRNEAPALPFLPVFAMDPLVLSVGVAVVAILLLTLYLYLTSTFDYFEKRGILGPKPLPLFGNYYGLKGKTIGEIDAVNVRQYGKVYGIFEGRVPNLIIADPHIAKAILDKEKNNFRLHRAAKVASPILKRSLQVLAGETKDSNLILALKKDKIRKLVPRLLRSTDTLVEDLKKVAKDSDGKVNITDCVSRFLANVLSQTILDKDPEKNAETNIDLPTFAQKLNNAFANNTTSVFGGNYYIPPNVQDDFVLKGDALKYFLVLLQTAIKEKESLEKDDVSEKRVPDVIDLLQETIEEQKQLLKDEEKLPEGKIPSDNEILLSQCLAIILNSSYTTRSSISLSISTLAAKLEVQDKLHSELSKQLQSTDNVISYESIQNSQYLDMFFEEVLRMYPSEYRLEHDCVENTEFENLKIEKNTMVTIPVYALHHLEDLYPESEIFKPERFSPEEAEKRHPCSYLPFGLSGANAANVCVQFGVLVSKIAISTLIKNFKFAPADETLIPPQFEEGVTGVARPKPVIVSIQQRK